MEAKPDRKVLLDIGDGPEGIQVYISEDEGVVDWSSDLPALYITASIQGAFVKLGPFYLKSIREKFEKIEALNREIAELRVHKCSRCHEPTDLACSDCAIDLGTKVFVCGKKECRDRHDEKCPYRLQQERDAALQRMKELEASISTTEHGILGDMAQVKANQQNYCPCCAKPKMNCDCAYEGEK